MTEPRDDREDRRLDDGIEHLRAAAREMIGASRALLDVAEELLERPDGVGDLLAAVGSVGDQLRRGARASMGGTPRGHATDADGTSDLDEDPIERITVEG